MSAAYHPQALAESRSEHMQSILNLDDRAPWRAPELRTRRRARSVPRTDAALPPPSRAAQSWRESSRRGRRRSCCSSRHRTRWRSARRARPRRRAACSRRRRRSPRTRRAPASSRDAAPLPTPDHLVTSRWSRPRAPRVQPLSPRARLLPPGELPRAADAAGRPAAQQAPRRGAVRLAGRQHAPARALQAHLTPGGAPARPATVDGRRGSAAVIIYYFISRVNSPQAVCACFSVSPESVILRSHDAYAQALAIVVCHVSEITSK